MIYIVNQLKNARRKQGITQKNLADKAGVTQQTISALENGSLDPSLNLLLRLLRVLNLELKLEEKNG